MENFSANRDLGSFKLNRRSAKRVKFLNKVKFGIGEAVFPGSSYNISQNGILIHSFKAFLPKTSLNLSIYADNEVHNLNSEVMWVLKTNDNTGSFMGLNFTGNNFEIGKLYQKELELSFNRSLPDQLS